MKPGEEIRRASQVAEAEISRILAGFNRQQGVVVDNVQVAYLDGAATEPSPNGCPAVRFHIETS